MTTPNPDMASGHVLGMTANSFSSVSLDPPLIQWCIDVKAHRYQIYADATVFGVNILSAGQEDLSRRFAKQNAHIVPDDMLMSEKHPLRMNHVVGFLACDVFDTRIVGDHLVIVGQVTSFDMDEAREGLTFFRGKYGQIGIVS
ncbi:flavin reductase like domain protein [Asticcacaulis biprosthecium C19]|uniref:Flavin reductase like domain protein n=2 Tax=Asticcacaulis biprosthecium TaxID=76891 RepID=F4QQY6_9CAUL|nr:flavin reductase like domain protein [Asticcacaulis biprosthecium C19]